MVEMHHIDIFAQLICLLVVTQFTGLFSTAKADMGRIIIWYRPAKTFFFTRCRATYWQNKRQLIVTGAKRRAHDASLWAILLRIVRMKSRLHTDLPVSTWMN